MSTQRPPEDESRRGEWERRSSPWLVATAVIFLAAYAWPILDPGLSPAAVGLCAGVAWVMWAVFAVDLVARCALSRRRWRFLLHHPIDIAVVLLPTLAPLRVLRLLAVMTTLHRTSADVLRGRVTWYIGGGAVTLAGVGALAILEAERGAPGALITSLPDALWWALTTMTTVGYGDLYPVTQTGRLVAAGLMVAGIALLGSVTASLAAWLTRRLEATDEGQDEVQAELARIGSELAQLRAELAAARDAGTETGTAERATAASSAFRDDVNEAAS